MNLFDAAREAFAPSLLGSGLCNSKSAIIATKTYWRTFLLFLAINSQRSSRRTQVRTGAWHDNCRAEGIHRGGERHTIIKRMFPFRVESCRLSRCRTRWT